MQWYLTVLRRYADFSGRARRREYWMFTLVNGIIGMVLSVLDSGLDLRLGSGGTSGGVLGTVYGLATLVPGLAVAARRLHDIDRTGWWQLLPVAPFVFLFAVIPFMVSGNPPTAAVVGFFAVIAMVFAAAVVLLVWTVTDGTRGPNRFGPNPKEPFPTPVPPQVR